MEACTGPRDLGVGLSPMEATIQATTAVKADVLNKQLQEELG